MEENRLPKLCWNRLKEISLMTKKPIGFCKNIMDIINHCGLTWLNYRLNYDDIQIELPNILKIKIEQLLQQDLAKLSLTKTYSNYRLLYDSFIPENYFSCNLSSALVSFIAQIRLMSTMIKENHIYAIKKEDLYCGLCGSQITDEIYHFIAECGDLEGERKKILKSLPRPHLNSIKLIKTLSDKKSWAIELFNFQKAPQTPQMSPQEEQEKCLDKALGAAKAEAFQMKRCLDKNKVMEALKHASSMLAELRTSVLSPKNMAVSDELRQLELHLLDEFQKGRKVNDLYELVQYAGNIIPRLYLLTTVGIIYMKTNEQSKKKILKDLVEMSRGVQHPLRGLFLRNYLLQCTRNILPDVEDTGTGGENGGGTVKDSVDFILLNFAEMNKLWVRMQHQGHTRDRDKREKERQELRLLVGTNLVRLAELEAVDAEKYKKIVLPGILEQVVSCRDAIAQEYLMECIIQVFPDEFHLQTLPAFLRACAELQSHVNVKNIIIALIERLAQYATKQDGAGIPSDIKLFDIFSEQVAQIIQCRVDMSPEDRVSLQAALVTLALKCYPERADYVDQVLGATADLLGGSPADHSSPVGRELLKLLKSLVSAYNNLLALLQLEHFPRLLGLCDFHDRKALACCLATNALEHHTRLTTPAHVDRVLTLFSPLVKDQEDQPTGQPEQDPEDFAEEQVLVGKLVNLMVADTPDQQYLILKTARKHFSQGGTKRLHHTLPPLIFQAYQLSFQYKRLEEEDEMWGKKCEKIFEFCNQTINALIEADMAELPMRLFLQGALAMDQIRFPAHETMAYEFITQVFPDEFHLQTLPAFLRACAELQSHVNVKNIIIALIERLAQYATKQDGAGIPSDIKLFDIFSEQVAQIIQCRVDMSPEDRVSLQAALVTLALKCYPERADYVDQVLGATADLLGGSPADHSSPVGRELLKLLKSLVSAYNNLLALLQLEHFPRLLGLCDFHDRKALACCLATNALEHHTRLTTPAHVDRVLTLFSPLVKDQEDQPTGQPEQDPEDFAEEQVLVGKLVNLMVADTPDQQYLILKTARKHFSQGGTKRLHHTLPPLIFQAYQLSFQYKRLEEEDEMWGKKCEKIFEFCNQTINALIEADMAELPMRLFLQGALAMDQIRFPAHETMAYEFITQAFTLYEEEISSSKAQLAAIALLIATVEQMSCFTPDNHEPLCRQLYLAPSRLFKKPDQCRGLCLAAHLFWSGKSLATSGDEIRDLKEVVECLKRAIKVAGQCFDDRVKVQLYVEILNHLLYFLEKSGGVGGEEGLGVAQQLLAKVRELLPGLEATEETAQINSHFDNTLHHIRQLQESKDHPFHALSLGFLERYVNRFKKRKQTISPLPSLHFYEPPPLCAIFFFKLRFSIDIPFFLFFLYFMPL
ncbi:VPS35 [Cordylochernes scorpioides]|uniref:VPS35 n=1 Tax=Cordylochernes scorpioides TaxID=51811 RepID=A0ABY6KGR4_9ARAC|nr:VPS35 [Cordylochernes scorpioides]